MDSKKRKRKKKKNMNIICMLFPKTISIQKLRPRPSQAGAKPWLAALARPGILESQSRLRLSQSRGFQAKPGRNITTSKFIEIEKCLCVCFS
jgi:hypothetical protein